MTQLHERIEIARPIHEAFAYISDFTTCTQWDSTAISAERTTPGPIQQGTGFTVRCALPLGSVKLTYTMTDFEHNRALTLRGVGPGFTVTDRIEFEPTETGCVVDYRADFEFGTVLKALAAKLEPGLQRMGRASIQRGLKTALENQYPAPTISGENERADRSLIRALSRFSRWGYHRGAKSWNPVSAWMGDRHVVLTGATAGLGLACAQQLAETGCRLTLVVRNEERGRMLIDSLIRDSGNPRIHLKIADLSLMADVDRLVQELSAQALPVDVLINNAGALFNPRQVTSEGLEQSFALLLLSPYRLTLGLHALLKKSGSARVINVVSGGLYSQKLNTRDLQNEYGDYSGSKAYARAKRALLITTEQWAQQWQNDGIVVNAMHPGWADTPGVQTSLPAFRALTRPILRTPQQGADTITWLAQATEAGAISGRFFLDREPRTTHLTESTRESEPDRLALAQALEKLNSER